MAIRQITAASAVLYNASLSLAAAGQSDDGLLMEVGSAAAQALANGECFACVPHVENVS
jgi:hypothetical protein